MSNKSRKIVVAGCGYWGKNLVRNFAELGYLDSVCDNDGLVAKQYAEQYGVKCRQLDEALADSNIDGVVIATPAATHAAIVEQALLADKHVFVEKPLALDVITAIRLKEISEEKNKILMVGHLLQYHPVFLRLKKIIAAGELGDLQHIYSHRLNLGKIRREENILWSFAPHDVSMILALVGSEPEAVSAIGGSYLQKNVVDVTTTHLSFAGGVNAHIFVSWLHPFKEQKLVIVGENAMAVFDDTKDWDEKLMLYSHSIDLQNEIPLVNRADGKPVDIEKDEPLKLEAQHFIDCINGDVVCRTDSNEAIGVLKVLQASEKAMKENRVIKMTEPDSSKNHSDTTYFVHESACIDADCQIGEGSKIWHFSHVMSRSSIGKNCVIGQNVMLGADVVVGNNCKIQNNVSIYKGVVLQDGVFCGPSCVFTNVINPRAEIERKSEFSETLVEKGATIGANATILCGITIGEYGFVAAGAVVLKSVQAFSLVAGVPARHMGWVCRCGERLAEAKSQGVFNCSRCNEEYSLIDGRLELLSK